MDKRELRKKSFAALRELSAEEKAARSVEICRLLQESIFFQKAEVLLSYIPLKSEPDLIRLMRKGKTWGFPVVEGDDSLTFHQIDSPETQLQEGDFGICEPITDICPQIDLAKVDLILVPGVGFDPETGDRLGRGKGHYDRFLSALSERREGDSPPQIIGISFSAQLCALNSEAHDIPMDTVLTEKGFT